MNVHPRAGPRMARVSLFGIVITMMLAGVAAWVSSSHSAVKAAVVSPQIDPFSHMANAKNLPRSYLKIAGRSRSAINVE